TFLFAGSLTPLAPFSHRAMATGQESALRTQEARYRLLPHPSPPHKTGDDPALSNRLLRLPEFASRFHSPARRPQSHPPNPNRLPWLSKVHRTSSIFHPIPQESTGYLSSFSSLQCYRTAVPGLRHLRRHPNR